MPRKLFTLVLCLVATAFVAHAQTQTPPDNEIWYTTTDGKIAELEFGEWHAPENGEDFEIVSHTYENGRGVIRVNKPIKVYGDWDQEYASTECSVGFWLRGEVQSVILPKGLIIIGYGAFSGCSSLTSITIPDSVTSIGGGAFGECNNLAEIVCLATKPPQIVVEWWSGDDYLGISEKTAPAAEECTEECPAVECVAEEAVPAVECVAEEAVPAVECATEEAVPAVECVAEEAVPAAECVAEEAVPAAEYSIPDGVTAKIYVPEKSVMAYKKSEYWSRYAEQIEPIK